MRMRVCWKMCSCSSYRQNARGKAVSEAGKRSYCFAKSSKRAQPAASTLDHPKTHKPDVYAPMCPFNFLGRFPARSVSSVVRFDLPFGLALALALAFGLAFGLAFASGFAFSLAFLALYSRRILWQFHRFGFVL